MNDLNESDFNDRFNNGKSYIQFSADWCGPCKALASTIQTLESDFDDINFFKINIEKCSPEFLQRFSVKSIPKVILVRDGQIQEEFLGMRQKEQLVKHLKNL